MKPPYRSWESLQKAIVGCDLCPRLRTHCTKMARVKRASFKEWTYWGKPVPNFGDPSARLLIVGLAPAAHGANRTGRVFTGDRSGDFLFRVMHETGFANQPTSRDIDDGLTLIDAAITAVAHCAPPDNKPNPDELANCDGYLRATFDHMPNLRVVMALGSIAFRICRRHFRERQWLGSKEPAEFLHGSLAGESKVLMGVYHPSQQNTFTGRLTPDMMREVFTTVSIILSKR